MARLPIAPHRLTVTPPRPGPGAGTSSPEALRAALERARAAPHLALLLDYDGTLVPFAPTPEQATPDAELMTLLRRLAARPRTETHLVSGRVRDTLERWFGALAVGLHAEHGFWSRAPGGPWRGAQDPGDAWREPVRALLREFCERTPGAHVEEKTAGLAWHHRAADPEQGALRARELSRRLQALLAGAPVELLPGAAVLEVRPRGVDKGRAVSAVLAAAPPGTLLLAAGDDRTDEDLFAALPEGSLALHVGPSPSRAPLRVADPAAARAFLAALVE